MIGVNHELVAKKNVAVRFERFHNGEEFPLGICAARLRVVKLPTIESDGLAILGYHSSELILACVRVNDERFIKVWVRQHNLPGYDLFDVFKRPAMLGLPFPLVGFGGECR